MYFQIVILDVLFLAAKERDWDRMRERKSYPHIVPRPYYFLIKLHSLCFLYQPFHFPNMLHSYSPQPSKKFSSAWKVFRSSFNQQLLILQVSARMLLLQKSLPDLLRVGQVSVKYPHSKLFFSFTTFMGCLNYIVSSIIIWCVALESKNSKGKNHWCISSEPGTS